MATCLIQSVVKQASLVAKLNNISPQLPAFRDLVSMINKLTAGDVGFSTAKMFFSESSPHKRHAPASFVDIYEDEDMNICIFSLNEQGSTLPLHDHPGMYGILKVIHGRVHIQAFSILDNNNPENVQSQSEKKGYFQRIFKPADSKWRRNSGDVPSLAVRTRALAPVILDAQGPACILTPQDGNLHVIRAVDGPAAFLDVLLPPYHPPDRDCHYYKEISESPPLEGDIVYLQRISQPSTYWCNTVVYDGPPVSVK